MLIQLKIENIALIEIIEINFEKGLNIITGDSGSGTVSYTHLRAHET